MFHNAITVTSSSRSSSATGRLKESSTGETPPTPSEEVAEVSPVLFKMQYREDGYGRENVVPGGFTPGNPKLYRYLSALRRRRDTAPREGVYARFSPNAEVRTKAIDALRRQDRFRYISGGLQPYTTYLHEIARSAICIDLPGSGDLCFRLVDCLAIGACTVRRKGETRLHVPLVAEENIAYCRDDVSDLVDVCAELLTDEPRRTRIANGAREYFDKYLAREQLAAYYLATTAEHTAGILTPERHSPTSCRGAQCVECGASFVGRKDRCCVVLAAETGAYCAAESRGCPSEGTAEVPAQD